MKKFLTAFTTILTAVFAIFFTTEIPNVNAAISSEVWTEATTDNMAQFYDLNNSGKVDILDLVYAKNNIINEGTISIYDLINLKHYLNTGELLSNLRYMEYDCDYITLDLDTIIKSASTGLLKEWKYEDNCLRTRFLRNAIVTELRFYNFEKPVSDQGHGMHPEFITFLGNFGEVWKNIHHKYFVEESFIINNSSQFGCGSNEFFETKDVLVVKSNTNSTTFYINRGDFVEAFELPNTTKPVTCTGIIYHDYCYYLLCREEPNGPLCNYAGASSYIDTNNSVIPNVKNFEELDAISEGRYSYNFGGEFINYDTINSNLFIRLEDDTIKTIHISPTNFADAKYIIKEWEKDGQKYVLGASNDNKFVWDTSSTFAVG